MIHSAPKFPDSPANSSYSGIHWSQTIHAQAFVCISMDASTLDAVGAFLRTTDLYIYSPHHLAQDLQAQYPNVVELLAQAKSRDTPLLPTIFQQNITFLSAGGPSHT